MQKVVRLRREREGKDRGADGGGQHPGSSSEGHGLPGVADSSSRLLPCRLPHLPWLVHPLAILGRPAPPLRRTPPLATEEVILESLVLTEELLAGIAAAFPHTHRLRLHSCVVQVEAGGEGGARRGGLYPRPSCAHTHTASLGVPSHTCYPSDQLSPG